MEVNTIVLLDEIDCWASVAYSFTEEYNKLLDKFSKLDFDIYYVTLYLKDEIINLPNVGKLKLEEIEYINNLSERTKTATLSRNDRLKIYRKLKEYDNKLSILIKQIHDIIVDDLHEVDNVDDIDFDKIILEFDVDINNIKNEDFSENYKDYLLKRYGLDIDNSKFKMTLDYLIYKQVNLLEESFIILANYDSILSDIFIFCCYTDRYDEDSWDYTENDKDCLAEYRWLKDNNLFFYEKDEMEDFEKEQIIIHTRRNVGEYETIKIFKEILLDNNIETIDECIKIAQDRIDRLNYERSYEYKEKMLLERISNLYKMVKGNLLHSEMLYNGKFLDILEEVYALPNDKIVKKEKVIKNNGKDSVIIIALTQDNKYIITSQNRMNEKIIAEFPSGYIERDEDVLDAASRELMEESGYVSDELSIIDQVYTSPGIDNSTTYIVFAQNCIKKCTPENKGTELVKYELFSEKELEYLVNNNIMSGAINKLAYYNLNCNYEDTNVTFLGKNYEEVKKLYKRQRRRKTTL